LKAGENGIPNRDVFKRWRKIHAEAFHWDQRRFLKSLSPEDIELFGDMLDADNNRLVDYFIGGKWKRQPHRLPLANDIVWFS
jgi:hypothetical protein